LVIAKGLEPGSFQLPPLSGTEDQIYIDGPTLTSLLAGIDNITARIVSFEVKQVRKNCNGEPSGSHVA
jgi:hypothetical protein